MTRKIVRVVYQLSLSAALTIVSVSASAGMIAFSGDAGEKLWIQDAPKLGTDAAIMKFEGIESDWQGKLLKVEKSNHSNGVRYHFDYKRGSKTLSYVPVVETGKTMIAGTITRRIELYIPKHKDPIVLKHDLDLTKSSQSTDLVGDFAKSPFTPNMKD